jgi:hypothetical protein
MRQVTDKGEEGWVVGAFELVTRSHRGCTRAFDHGRRRVDRFAAEDYSCVYYRLFLELLMPSVIFPTRFAPPVAVCGEIGIIICGARV